MLVDEHHRLDAPLDFERHRCSSRVADDGVDRDDWCVATSSDRVDGVRVVLGMIALMWVLEVVDLLVGHRLDTFGIQPRDLDGLVGVVTAPFLHFGFGHLVANTVPFTVLGLVIALGGAVRVLTVTVIAGLVSGAGVWLLAPAPSVTAGASGIVFGYAAYLIARGVVERSLPFLAIGAVVVAVWGTGLLAGVVPQAGVSWLGHLFGAAGGVLAARLLRRDRTVTVVARDAR
jgi:membrane associated rhomboid family serine protease